MSRQMPTEARLLANKECCFGVIGNSGGTGGGGHASSREREGPNDIPLNGFSKGKTELTSVVQYGLYAAKMRAARKSRR